MAARRHRKLNRQPGRPPAVSERPLELGERILPGAPASALINCPLLPRQYLAGDLGFRSNDSPSALDFMRTGASSSLLAPHAARTTVGRVGSTARRRARPRAGARSTPRKGEGDPGAAAGLH